MMHAATTIRLDEHTRLQVGFVMCFSAPTPQLFRVRLGSEGGPTIEGELSFGAQHLDEVIAALQRVREAMPKPQQP